MRKLLLTTFSILIYATTYAQNINTIVGGLGDGIPATNTPFYNPNGTAVDALGNIYIADYANHRIRKVNASTGIISTIAGSGIAGYGGDGRAATSAKLNFPTGLAVDDSGNVYIADLSNYRIRKVNAATGIISTVAGNGLSGFSGDNFAATLSRLNYPNGVAVDSSGNIYIADTYNKRIRKVSASTGIISTVAGNGIFGFGGDGSSATSAKLNDPIGVAVDASGNIYIADQSNHRIRKVTASTGIISTLAGNGIAAYGGDGSAATSANLNSPSGVAVDSAGNIYIADASNHRIRKVTASTGIISTVAGNGTAAYGGDSSAATSANLNNPRGIIVDGTNNIYIADAGNYRIRKVTASTGIISTVAGNGFSGFSGDSSLATSATLNAPQGIAVDGSGNIYIADRNSHRIRKVTALTGIISTIAGNGTAAFGGDSSAATLANLNNPNGVAVDGSGNIYIADTYNHRIRKLTASTGIISTIAGNGIGGYNLLYPTGVAVDGSGNIYIADQQNNRIRKVTVSTGIISTVAGTGTAGSGGDGSAATSANLYYPDGVAVDSAGNIYIADDNNHRIRKVTASTGIISTIAGNGSSGYGGDGSIATSTNLYYPSGVAMDGSGNIYISDLYNQRIRKVSASTGIISTVAGNGTFGFGCDGSAATSANLNDPIGLAVDGLGNIYIADAGNNRIRLVNYSIVNNVISYSQTICAGSSPASLTGSTPIGSTSSNTYSWLSSTTSATAGFTAIPSTNTKNYSPGILTQNRWFRRYVVSGAFTDTSAAVSITVNNAIANNTITSATQSICSNSIPTPIIATTATGGNGTTYKYKWLKSTTSAIAGFANAGGNDSTQNFTSGALTQNTWFKRRVSSGVCNEDTTAALLVTLKPTSTSTNIISICPNLLPFIWNGRNYNSNRTDTVYLTNAVGCDSITILKLTVKPTSTSTNNISICPSSLPYNWNNLIFNSAGTQTKTGLVNSVGCDSSATLNLTVKSTITSTNNLNICSSALPYTWNGLIFNAAGTKTKTGFTNSVGCDSSATLNLTVKSTSTSTNSISICPNALPYIWNGLVFNAAGTQTKTGLTNSLGCDSSATLNLTVNPIPSTSNITGLTNVARLDTTSYSVTGTSGSVFNWVTTKGLVQTGTNTNQIQVKWNAIGMDTLKVTETSNQGCVGSQKTLLVNIGPAMGMNEINTSSSILVYPNPFNETIFISLLNNSGLNKAILFDLLGKEVLTTHKSEIDVKELKSGVYLIMVTDNNGNSYSQKLVKN